MTHRDQFILSVSKAVIALFALLFCTFTPAAQFDSATVLGTVKDTNGAVLAGSTVTLKTLTWDFGNCSNRCGWKLSIHERQDWQS